jgi:hypothetical protein
MFTPSVHCFHALIYSGHPGIDQRLSLFLSLHAATLYALASDGLLTLDNSRAGNIRHARVLSATFPLIHLVRSSSDGMPGAVNVCLYCVKECFELNLWQRRMAVDTVAL